MNWSVTQSRLAADKGRWSHIARETGLHINAIRKIAVGETPTPRISSVEKIIEFYEREDASRRQAGVEQQSAHSSRREQMR